MTSTKFTWTPTTNSKHNTSPPVCALDFRLLFTRSKGFCSASRRFVAQIMICANTGHSGGVNILVGVTGKG